jgi:hypothetical protein
MGLLDGMKDLQEALAVTNRIQNRHALLIEDHERWLESQQKWMERTESWMERTQSWMERHQKWAEGTEEWAQNTQAVIDQITASQLVTQEGLQKLEATVQAFIDSLRRGGNGRGQ